MHLEGLSSCSLLSLPPFSFNRVLFSSSLTLCKLKQDTQITENKSS